MNKFYTLVLTSTITLFQSGFSNAQCILDQYYLGSNTLQATVSSNPAALAGQSFRAGYSGALDEVSMDISASNPGCGVSTMDVNVSILDGDGLTGTVLASEVFTLNVDVTRTLQPFAFTTPAIVTASQMYTITFSLIAGQDCGAGEPQLIWYFDFPTNFWNATGGTQYQNGVVTSLGNTQYFSTCVDICNLDVTVAHNAPTLTANATNVGYRWLDCDNKYAEISGETNQSFTPAVNGNYAVEITYNSCVDTSACYLVDYVGIQELNPTAKELVKIIDLMGRETSFKPNTPLIYLYSDGTTERVIKIEE